MLAAGCASSDLWRLNGWDTDYDTAEARRAGSDRQLLLFFRPADKSRPDPMFAALQGARLKEQTDPYTRCSLYNSYEPDRRYVAQYGVDRAPALIVVHRDGTYHALTGAASEAQISDFLAAAKPPGATARINPYIPRQTQYAWNTSLESAEAAAQKNGQPLLIVFDQWWSRDRQKLDKLLARREVYSRFAGMVHCRPSSIWSSGGNAMTRFGVMNVPALVILNYDGSHHTLELPTSYESIVRFADRARQSDVAATSTATAAP